MVRSSRPTRRPTPFQIYFAAPIDLDISSTPFALFIAQTNDYTHPIHLPQYSGTDQMNTPACLAYPNVSAVLANGSLYGLGTGSCP